MASQRSVSSYFHALSVAPSYQSDDLLSIAPTSAIEIPTKCQQVDGFRSNAPESQPKAASYHSSYSKGTNQDKVVLKGYGPAKLLPEAGGSWVWRYGWKIQHLKTGESC